MRGHGEKGDGAGVVFFPHKGKGKIPREKKGKAEGEETEVRERNIGVSNPPFYSLFVQI